MPIVQCIFCLTRRGQMTIFLTASSIVTFLLLSLLGYHFGVFQFLLYVSFCYSLTGLYLFVEGVFGGLGSGTASIFFGCYYIVGAILYLIGGFLLFSKGYSETMAIVAGVFAIITGAALVIFAIFGSRL
ncbi:uncharacterized protein LOC135399856 [Ornithodoros turicata]|uniref:uncharacterized protein LOC135399856 n=1 Tax=Ornithodoros turicata TaxID=34597 RepID=UPI003138EEEE